MLPEPSLTRRVLLAGYDKSLRETMGAKLEKQGFRVVAVSSVAEALGRIAAERFHLLFVVMSFRDSEILTRAFHEGRDYKWLVNTPLPFNRNKSNQTFELPETVHAEDGRFPAELKRVYRRSTGPTASSKDRQ